MKKLLLLLLLSLSCSAFSKGSINYPNLSESKEIIKQRSTELRKAVEKARQSKSDYQLSEAYGKLAQFYHAHDYIDVAIQLYEKSVELEPSNSKWHYLLAMAYKSRGDFDLAEQSFKNAWKYNSGYLSTKVYLAEMYMQQGEFDKAKAAYSVVLKKDSNFPRALVGLGQIEMQQGNAQKAIELYKKALKIQPQATQINFLLAQAYASLGKREESQKYNALKGKMQAQMYDPLIMHMLDESRSSSYYNDKAVRAYMAKDFANSEKLALKAIKYDKDSPYPYVTLANIYVATGRALKATKVLEGIIVDNQKDPNLKYSVGVIEEILGNNDKSIYWYKKVLELDPKHRKAQITLASALMRKHDFKKALKELIKAEKLDSSNAYLIHKKAVIYAYLNQCEKAENEIYKAVKLLPKNFPFLISFVKIAVQCKVSPQMLSDALNAARNMYQISQENIIVEVLAMIEAKNGNYNDAIDYQAQVIFQVISDKNKQNKKKLKFYKKRLQQYKDKKYPHKVFEVDDPALNPQSFDKIK